MKRNNAMLAVAAAVAVGFAPWAALANGYVTTTPAEPVAVQEAGTRLAFPGIFGAPSAIPAPGGTGYVELTYANPRGGIAGNDADGDIRFAYTIGDPVDAVSVSLGVAVTSLEDDFGDSGNFFINASRMISSSDVSATFVGLSAGDLHGWGDAADDEEAISGYISHLRSFQAGGAEVPVQFTLGYGNRTTYDADLTGELEEGVFAGVGVGVSETLSLSASATATQLNIGANLTIPQVPGLGVTVGVYDVTDAVERQQFRLAVSFGF